MSKRSMKKGRRRVWKKRKTPQQRVKKAPFVCVRPRCDCGKVAPPKRIMNAFVCARCRRLQHESMHFLNFAERGLTTNETPGTPSPFLEPCIVHLPAGAARHLPFALEVA